MKDEIKIDPKKISRWKAQGEWQCKVCGCTEAEACVGGCYWVEENLCSNCVGKLGMVEFFMAMDPPRTTHQQKQVNFKTKRFYEDGKLKAARSKLMAHLGRHVPVEPFSGEPLRVVVKWIFPLPKSKKYKDGDWKYTKPDTHNLNKLLFDVMEDLGFWDNDAIVASEIIEKFWGEIPGIYICISRLKE